jgi:uncharacterized protein YkwD
VKFSARRAIICALLFSTLFAGSVTSAPSASAATTHSERRMQYLINVARQHYGRQNLRLDDGLSALARRHSYWMAKRGYIFHTSDLAGALSNFTWRVAGENVGEGPTIDLLHRAFMNSPHHRDNNLYRGYRRVGIGVVWKGGIAFITVMFLS